jgi:3-deoxy-D-arabino-heptulosonate 7-phosphate (DAHP) synthase
MFTNEEVLNHRARHSFNEYEYIKITKTTKGFTTKVVLRGGTNNYDYDTLREACVCFDNVKRTYENAHLRVKASEALQSAQQVKQGVKRSYKIVAILYKKNTLRKAYNKTFTLKGSNEEQIRGFVMRNYDVQSIKSIKEVF